MVKKSKRIQVHDDEILSKINSETMKLWNKYKIDMSLRELSEKTIAGYQNDLESWWIYIYKNQGNQSIVDLTEDDITEFLYFCKTEGNNSRRMKRRMASISAFYKFLRKKKLIAENPMEFMDRPKKDTDIITQTFLTVEQVQELRIALQNLVKNADTHHKKHRALQYQCYALFSLSTMARVNAVANTKWEQIDFDNRVVNDVVEKEGYVVTLYFSEEVKELLLGLLEYRKTNNIIDNGYVFVSYTDGKFDKVTNGTLNSWCHIIGEMINVPTLHAHDFRHSAATLYKNAGMSLEDVSALLNHSGTDVTRKFYIRVDKKKISQNKDKFDF